ncbi:hypothetical protein PoB_006412900 [Plakobranchus ocellatus]|uniref:Uncharacterized protein n=1 Tax=Plakobranchus ocellatus TaxID=259542 RepID=A0AAV4D0M1_9GAST|nr:hypothetical protein PoB_006412900 [Plakobranchus ocellatus]
MACPQQCDLRLSDPSSSHIPAAGLKSATKRFDSWFLYIASPQQGDLRLSGPPPGQDADGKSRSCDRRIPVDLRADSLATIPPTPPRQKGLYRSLGEFDNHLATKAPLNRTQLGI